MGTNIMEHLYLKMGVEDQGSALGSQGGGWGRMCAALSYLQGGLYGYDPMHVHGLG